jgi:hypothetical protein
MSAQAQRQRLPSLNTNLEASTWKREPSLSLSLLVFGVGADDANDSAPSHNLAFVANLPYRRSYLHHVFLSPDRWTSPWALA